MRLWSVKIHDPEYIHRTDVDGERRGKMVVTSTRFRSGFECGRRGGSCASSSGTRARAPNRERPSPCAGRRAPPCPRALPVVATSPEEAYQVSTSALVTLSTFEQVLGKVGFGSLFATTGLYWSKAAFGKLKGHGTLEKSTMASANFALLVLLVLRWVDAGHFPLSNMYESLLFLSWGISSVHFYLAYKIPQSGVAGTLTSPTALGVLAFATLILPPELQRATALVPALKSNWLFMHVSVMMMSYATLLVGSLMSFGFLVIDLLAGEGASLPALGAAEAAAAPEAELAEPEKADEEDSYGGKRDLLETCDDLAYRSIGLGFAFLTIGIISGAVWANEAWGSYWR